MRERRCENEFSEARVRHNKNGDAAPFAGIPVSNLAPQVGLEPTTLRLRMFLCFHIGADYLINFPDGKVAGRSWESYRFGSSTPSLCTFLLTMRFLTCLFSRLRSGLPCQPIAAGVGFPEFTRFFNHSHLWKLQITLTAECSAIELLRKTRPALLPGEAVLGRGEFL